MSLAMNRRLRRKQPEPAWYQRPPTGDAKITAAQLQGWYGTQLAEAPLAAATSPYLLHQALVRTYPTLKVSHGCVKNWWQKYKVVDPAHQVSTVEELEEKHGSRIRPLATENNTYFKLCRALRDLDPPVYIGDKVAENWLRRHGPHGDLTYVDSAGHLETSYGQRIREDGPGNDVTSEVLRAWLFDTHSVSVPARVCKKWLETEWSSSGKLLSPTAVEQSIGERLRLNEYKHKFVDDAAAQTLVMQLAESQPPVSVSVVILRQWYTKYHPDSGPLRYDTAQTLEEAMGDHMRRVYTELGYRPLRAALSQRRKAVLVSKKVIESWEKKYSSRAQAASSSSSSGKRKRTASSTDALAPVCKSIAVAAATDQSAPVSGEDLTDIVGPARLEAACGDRYRREFTDLGLGLATRDMQRQLRQWGYAVSTWTCREWLRRYRLGDGSRDGCVALYNLSRQDLQRWHYVESMIARNCNAFQSCIPYRIAPAATRTTIMNLIKMFLASCAYT